jgi:hypothetical protein
MEQQERQRTQQATAAINAARADRENGMGAAAAVAAAAGGAKLTTEMALAVINMRNRDKNVLKVRLNIFILFQHRPLPGRVSCV